jgi:hypothetical protein
MPVRNEPQPSQSQHGFRFPLPISAQRLFDSDRWKEIRSPAGEGYNHPVAVRVNRGGEITEVTKEGTRVYAGEPFDREPFDRGPGGGRGVRIEIDFDAEHGMRWILGLTFHKGMTFADVVMRHGQSGVWPDVIWRR